MEEDNEIEKANCRLKNKDEDTVTRTSRKKNGKQGRFVSKLECSAVDESKCTSLLARIRVMDISPLLCLFVCVVVFLLYLQERILLFNWFI